MKHFLAFLFALFFATPAAAEPVTPATFDAALAAAQGGERIELAGGDYGSLNITGVTFSSDVTIVSADPANPAIVSGLSVGDTSHLVFDGILFDYVAGPDDVLWTQVFQVYNSAYITIRNSVFDGEEFSDASAPGLFGTGRALMVSGSDNVVVENNLIFKFWKAITVEQSTNISVSHNDVHTIRSDGFNFVSVDGLLVEGNWIHDFKTVPGSGDHPDMIQFWTVLGQMSSKNVIIRGNFLDAGTGSWSQSIFMANEVMSKGQGSFEDYAYQNILIEHNVIYNDHVHGISVGDTDGLTVLNNTLLYDPVTISPRGWTPQIRLSAGSLNVTVENNITADFFTWSMTTDHPGWTVGNNLLVQNYKPNAANYYGDLFVNALVGPASLADLRAVAGGVIEIGAIGAAMTRFDIPMVVGPYTTPPAGVCEALLAEALAVVDDLEAQMGVAQVMLTAMTGERDAALAERDTAITALSDAEAALVSMTAERDAALVERDDALLAQAAALTDLETAETQLSVEVGKLNAIREIVAM